MSKDLSSGATGVMAGVALMGLLALILCLTWTVVRNSNLISDLYERVGNNTQQIERIRE